MSSAFVSKGLIPEQQLSSISPPRSVVKTLAEIESPHFEIKSTKVINTA